MQEGEFAMSMQRSRIIWLHAAFFLSVAFPVQAQLQLKPQWVARYDGPTHSGDRAKAIAIDDSGNVYLTGSTSYGDFRSDYATVKYSAKGVGQWIAQYNGTGNRYDDAVDIAVDLAGNVYVTGSSSSFGDETDFTTIKYSANGVELWAARHNPPGIFYDKAVVLAIDDAGNVYVTGSSRRGSIPDDYLTIKYDTNGAEQWVARYDGPGNAGDGASAIAVDDSGNVYVTGWSAGSGTHVDYATIKYNSNGVEQWVTRYNGPGSSVDLAVDLGIDHAGNVYVTGSTDDAGPGSIDYATIKYDMNGVEQWVSLYDGPSGLVDDRATALALDDSGNVYVTGSSPGLNNSADEYATIKYNGNGVQQWVARYNGVFHTADRALAIAIDKRANIYVTGLSNDGNFDDCATVKYNSRGEQLWVSRYNGLENGNDVGAEIVVDGSVNANVYVAGWSRGNFDDYLTIKYVQNPELSVTPVAINFLNVAPGGHRDSTIVIQNIDAGDLVLGTITSPSPFVIIGDTCSGRTFTTYKSCQATIRFAPPSPGFFLDTPAIRSNDPDDSLTYVELRGVGEGDTLQVYSVDPSDEITGRPRRFHLIGKRFEPNMKVVLDRGGRGEPGRAIITADTVEVISESEAYATFNLKESDLGRYDLAAFGSNNTQFLFRNAAFLLHYLVVSEITHEKFGGYPIGVERWSHLLVTNIGNDSGIVLIELVPPAPKVIELRLMSENGDTLWYTKRDSLFDSKIALILPFARGQTRKLNLAWRVPPEKVLPPPGSNLSLFHSTQALQDDDEFVIIGQTKQISWNGIKGAAKDQIKGMIRNAIFNAICNFIKDRVRGLPVTLRGALNNIVDATISRDLDQEVFSPIKVIKDIATELGSTAVPEFVGLSVSIGQCLGGIIDTWITSWHNHVDGIAKEFCKQSLSERLESIDKLQAERRGSIFGNRALLAVSIKQAEDPGASAGIIRGAWDPNDKTTSGNYIGAGDTTKLVYLIPSAAFNDAITYTILFENKAQATDSAQNVVIRDTLDMNLDLATLQIDSSAARGSFSWSLIDRVLAIRFLGIKLPPNQNPPEGEWGASYSVRMKPNLPLGTKIRNRASIVFDFNPPILTPEVVHIVGAPEITATSTEINFGKVDVGASVAETLWVKNVGGFDLAIGQLTGLTAPFMLKSDSCSGRIIMPDDSCRIIITFAPTTTGSFSDTLQIPSSDLSKYPFLVKVTGGEPTSVGHDKSEMIPKAFALHQAHPNPFNPTTTIKFDLPRPAVVSLKIYDILGREILALIDDQLYEAGSHQVSFQAKQFSSGAYFYRISAEAKGKTFVDVKKMLLLK